MTVKAPPRELPPTAPEPIFGVPEVLPRGPHRLTRRQVAASQRVRLWSALADVVGEMGYAAATIGDITGRAGVSPRSFYEHYQNKESCLLAAYDAFVGVLLIRMSADLRPDSDWHHFITSSLDAYLGTLETSPGVARAFLIEMGAAGPTARERQREAYRQFAGLIKTRHELIRRQDSTLAPLPDRVYLGLALGVRALVCDALEAGARPRLTELVPDAVFWITATIAGAEAAERELGGRPVGT